MSHPHCIPSLGEHKGVRLVQLEESGPDVVERHAERLRELSGRGRMSLLGERREDPGANASSIVRGPRSDDRTLTQALAGLQHAQKRRRRR
jgi:hypothetical protein